jgi:hypothetical protein
MFELFLPRNLLGSFQDLAGTLTWVGRILTYSKYERSK